MTRGHSECCFSEMNKWNEEHYFIDSVGRLCNGDESDEYYLFLVPKRHKRLYFVMGNIKLLQKAKWQYHFVCYNCKEEKLIEYIAATDSQYLDICGDCKNKILAENGIEITEPTHAH